MNELPLGWFRWRKWSHYQGLTMDNNFRWAEKKWAWLTGLPGLQNLIGGCSNVCTVLGTVKMASLSCPSLIFCWDTMYLVSSSIFLRLFISIEVKRENSFWIRYKLMKKTFYYEFNNIIIINFIFLILYIWY